jgi:hypothetical protein
MRAIVPEDLNRNGSRAVASLARAAVCIGLQSLDPDPKAIETLVRARGWDDDRAAGFLTRAAASPATTTTTGWAKELAGVATAFLAALVPASAGADLLSRALQVSFGRAASLTLPPMTPGLASFVGEGTPIPMESFSTAGASMEPRKLAAIVEASHESPRAG